MASGKQEAERRNLVAQAALVWGGIGDLDRFIRTGEMSPPRPKTPAPITPDVERYNEAIRRAGRFIMPEEVDRWLQDAPDAPPADQVDPAEPTTADCPADSSEPPHCSIDFPPGSTRPSG